MSAWERSLQGQGGGTLGSTVRTGAANQAQQRSQAASAARLQGLANDPAAAARVGRAPAPVAKPQPDKPKGGSVYDLPDPGTYSWKDADPDPYPAVLPALSAGQLGALAERRRLADQRLKQAQTEKERGTALLEASAIRARESATRDSKRSIEDFMREAAGKSVARSPMVAGRFQRRAGEDLRLSYGEIDTRLSTEIAALQDMVSQAELARADELAGIEQEEVNMRADLERLFPAAGMYG